MTSDLTELSISDPAGELLGIWEAERRKAGTVCAPKAALSMQRLRAILPYIYLSEWVSNNSLIIRLSGTQLDEWLGKNFAGTDLLAYFNQSEQLKNTRFYQTIRQSPCAGKIVRDHITGELRPKRFVYTTIQLPLCNRAGDVSHVIGVGFYDVDHLGSVNARVELERTVVLRHEHYDIGAGITPFDGG